MRRQQLWHSLQDVPAHTARGGHRTLGQRRTLVTMLNNALRDALSGDGWRAYAHYLHSFHADGLQGSLFYSKTEPVTDQEMIAQEQIYARS